MQNTCSRGKSKPLIHQASYFKMGIAVKAVRRLTRVTNIQYIMQ